MTIRPNVTGTVTNRVYAYRPPIIGASRLVWDYDEPVCLEPGTKVLVKEICSDYHNPLYMYFDVWVEGIGTLRVGRCNELNTATKYIMLDKPVTFVAPLPVKSWAN